MGKQNIFLSLAVTGILLTGSIAFSAIEEHAEITGPFETPMEVTMTCLECHEDASMEVMKTTHWTWESEQVIEGKKVKRGKKNVINNFCVAVTSNEPRCTSCHAGYGWKDSNFDFSDETRVDCLVCHDNSGMYVKPKDAPAGAGMPAGFTGKEKFDKKPYDLEKIAQSAGMPTRKNCLVCHANGGGGNAIKHGDIDTSLMMPGYELDIHMDVAGNNFSCQECHTTEEHQVKGNALVVSPGVDNAVACVDCHDAEPHEKKSLNKHVAAVACQTCHIPTFAKEYPTKMFWDWSKAQNPKNLPKEEQVVKKDGHPVYIAKKGAFEYGKDVVPEYHWYNGSGGAYALGDKIDPTKETKLNYPLGSKGDEKSKIMPFKAHRGIQPYDKKNSYFVVPKLFGSPKDPAAYWAQYDWAKAAAEGMKQVGLEFSGEIDFAPSVTYWPINHMVAPAKKALKCNACHGKKTRLDWQALGYDGDPRKSKKK